MNIIELILDEDEELSGIEAISVVEEPAIEMDFLALKSQKEYKFAEIDNEKHILMGAALIPEKPIYRTNGEDEFYIYFSKDTVRKASQLFLKKGNQGKSTLEHAQTLKGMTVVESWLDVPIGTWMISMKVDNDEIWTDFVKTGKVKGFSIEGYFADKLNRPQDKQKAKSDKLIKDVIDALEQ